MEAIYGACLFAAVLISTSLAQGLNDTCSWTSLRAASVQGRLYANGGYWSTSGNGQTNGIGGDKYSLDYSKPFNAMNNTNFSNLFNVPTVSGTQAYYGGTMFASDEAFWLYGGEYSGIGPAIPANEILGSQVYSSASGQTSVTQNNTATAYLQDISNYIVLGAGANVPSESLGFYFSGLVAPNLGQLVYDTTGYLPNRLASSMIQIDMSNPQKPQGRNLTLHANVPPRAGAELVWIPVSSQGILIAIGGLTTLNAPDLSVNFTSSDNSSNTNFMTSLPVYDIASQTWFIQNTTGEPPSQRAQFCSVMTNAINSSSFEIYIYGGTTGTATPTSLGDVWVLSVPSFTWTCAYDGDSVHSRDSHVCVRPYPDRMFAIGGQNSHDSSGLNCLDSTIDVFNLSSSSWMSAYDPSNYAKYEIPSAVASNIKATPTASGMNSTLLSLFRQPYQKVIPTYYPYAPAAPANTSTPPNGLPQHHKSNHLAAILGSVLGALGLFVIILAIWFFCRPKPGKRSRVQSWIKGVDRADTSVATDDTLYEVDGSSKDPARVEVEGGTVHPSFSPRSPRAEAGGTERYEMLALGPGSPGAPVEMPTPYHFGDHPTYPRNPSDAGKPTLSSDGRQPSATDSPDLSAPSPNAKPQGSSAVVTDEATSTAAVGSSPVPSTPQSPPFDSGIEQRPSHKRNVSSLSSGLPVSASSPERSPTLNAMERNSGLGYSSSRPNHMRNLSSVSSGLSNQLVSPAEPDAGQRLPPPVTASSAPGTATDEVGNNAGNIAEANLPVNEQPAAAIPDDDVPGPAAETQQLISHEALQQTPEPRFNRNVVPRKKLSGQSAFKEEDVDSSAPS